MADDPIREVPPLPKKGSLISEQSLYLTEISLYRNTLAFGGQRNPTSIWASMMYNHPTTMSYYRELEEKDEDVSNALDTLKLTVTSRARNVQPANDKDSLAVDIKDFIDQQLEQIEFDTVLDCILDAPGYGFSVQEMIFDVSAGQASLVEIADCPQELFLFGNRFRPQVGALQFLDQPWASEGVEAPESKFVITSYRKRQRNRMGRPLLKNVFWPSWFKRNMQRLWVQYAEKGPGTAVVYYNDPDNASEKKLAAEIAQAIIDNVAISVPQSFKLETELLKIARSQNPSVYKEFLTLMQYAITRRILGETLTSFGNEGGRGSQAQGKVHADTLDARSVALSKHVMSIVNKQVIRPLVLWNYGPDAPMPKLTIEIAESEDLVKRVNVDSSLQKMGKQFDANYVTGTYGVPLVKGEDPTAPLAPNAAALPANAPDTGDGAAFAEGTPEQQAHREMKEFDDLFAQLRDDAGGVLRERVGELAGSVIPVERK
jgi:phage gp29-like protein